MSSTIQRKRRLTYSTSTGGFCASMTSRELDAKLMRNRRLIVSAGDVDAVLQTVEGEISYRAGQIHRHPFNRSRSRWKRPAQARRCLRQAAWSQARRIGGRGIAARPGARGLRIVHRRPLRNTFFGSRKSSSSRTGRCAFPVDALFDIEGGWERSRKAMKQALRRAKVPRRRWPQSLHWNWAGKCVLIVLRRRPQDYCVFGLRVGQESQ